MISKQTAVDIALAYREVESGETLLAEIVKALETRGTPDIRDEFGRPAGGLQLGIPSGGMVHQLFNVPWSLAKPVIEAHVAHYKNVIAALSEKARIENMPCPLQDP